MLFCLSEADKGGESKICFNRHILANLDKEIVQRVSERTIRYTRNLSCDENSPYPTWQTTFETMYRTVLSLRLDNKMKLSNLK